MVFSISQSHSLSIYGLCLRLWRVGQVNIVRSELMSQLVTNYCSSMHVIGKKPVAEAIYI